MKTLSKNLTNTLLLSLCITIAGCTTYGRSEKQIEVTDGTENKSLDLLQQVNELEAESSELKNQVEVLQYELDQVNRRAQTQQAELDRLYQAEGLSGYTYEDDNATGSTLGGAVVVPQSTDAQGYPVETQEIEIGTEQSGSTVTPSTQSVPTATSALTAQQMYNNGFEQLKQGQYPESIDTFSQLLAAHPSSTFADDAQYWSGEAHYVNRDFNSALEAFNKVVRNYPSSDRAPDALLKIGYIYYEQGDADNARNVFNDIIARYPNERVSDFARERLKNL